MFILCTVCILLSFKTVCSTYPFWYFAYFSAFNYVTISRQEIEFENRTFRHMWHINMIFQKQQQQRIIGFCQFFSSLLNFVKHFQESTSQLTPMTYLTRNADPQTWGVTFWPRTYIQQLHRLAGLHLCTRFGYSLKCQTTFDNCIHFHKEWWLHLN